MIKMSQFTMSVLFLKEVLRLAERTDIGCATTLQLNWIYAVAIFNDARTPEEMERAIPYFKKAAERARRTQGEDHALTLKFERTLADARGVIDGAASPGSRTCPLLHATICGSPDASPTVPMWPRTRRRSSGSGHAQSIAGVRSVAGSEMRHRCRQRRAPGRSRSFRHSRFVFELPCDCYRRGSGARGRSNGGGSGATYPWRAAPLRATRAPRLRCQWTPQI